MAERSITRIGDLVRTTLQERSCSVRRWGLRQVVEFFFLEERRGPRKLDSRKQFKRPVDSSSRLGDLGHERIAVSGKTLGDWPCMEPKATVTGAAPPSVSENAVTEWVWYLVRPKGWESMYRNA